MHDAKLAAVMIKAAKDDKRSKLLVALRELGEPGDPEYAHGEADRLLLDYLNDPEITAAYEAITRWYA